MFAAFIALPHTQSDILWDYLCKYTAQDSPLVMAKEISKKSHQDISGQHFHIYTDWTYATWETFIKTILKKQFGLRGKANKDKSRQYGKVGNIRDDHKMLVYTVKQGDYRSKNIDKEYLKNIYENESYEKEDKTDYQETLMQHLLAVRDNFLKINKDIPYLNSALSDNPIKVYDLAEEILLHHMENRDKPICRTKLEYYISYYLQCVEPYRLNKFIRQQTLCIILKRI